MRLLSWVSVIKADVLFGGGGLTDMTVKVRSATPNDLTTAFDVHQAVANGTLQTTALFFGDQYTANQLTALFTALAAM